MRVTGDHKLDINHIEKLITILLAGLAVVLISDQYLVTAFIVAGLPHILLAYV